MTVATTPAATAGNVAAATPAVASAGVAVSVRGLVKSFGAIRALDDVSLDVHRGELLSLLGSSGCGKTTLLRTIGGFESPTSGEVILGGRNVVGDPPYRRRTNMVFQHLALFPHLSVARNVAFGLEVKKLRPADIERKVKDVLALVRLAGYEDRGIDALSGGQKQRVAIARAIVNEPEVLLLDEPLGALDLQLRLAMHDELKRIHRETGSTWIFVTHDQGEAITLSDRIAVMSEGRIVQLGTPREIYERPSGRFVARFVGHANFIEARCRGRTPDGRCTIDADGWLLEGVTDANPVAGDHVLAVLRHEKVRVAAPGSDGSGVQGTVIDATYLGPAVRLTVKLDRGPTLVAEHSSIDAATLPRAGERAELRWDPGHLVVVTG